MERGTWNVERGRWNVERGTWNVQRATWNVERGTRNADCGTWNVEHKIIIIIMRKICKIKISEMKLKSIERFHNSYYQFVDTCCFFNF